MFQSWSDLEIKEAVNSTHLRDFSPGTVITHGTPEHGEVLHVCGKAWWAIWYLAILGYH